MTTHVSRGTATVLVAIAVCSSVWLNFLNEGEVARIQHTRKMVIACEGAWLRQRSLGGYDAGGVNFSAYPEYNSLVAQGKLIIPCLIEILADDPCREVAACAVADILKISNKGLASDPCKFGARLVAVYGSRERSLSP
jgi:hypothetical protein